MQPRITSLLLLVGCCLCGSSAAAPNADPVPEPAMLYQPAQGEMWDPSIIQYEGKFYLFSMYANPENGRQEGIWLATSDDGVFWNDGREVIRAAKFADNRVWKGFVHKVGNRFVLNHGAFTSPQSPNNRLRFYTSTSLVDWEFAYELPIEGRYYNRDSGYVRWDHMYVIPKEAAHPERGYYGYVVAVPKTHSGFGLMESADGLRFTPLPPPAIDESAFPVPSLELGGCEKIGETYFLIGGVHDYFGNTGYGCYTLRAASPTGPFAPDAEAYRLCGTSGPRNSWGVQFLAAWVQGTGEEKLIANYASHRFLGGHRTTGSGVWLLPMRRAVVDRDNHLRLKYWANNDKAKGAPLPCDPREHTLVFPASTNERASTIDLNATADALTFTAHKDTATRSWTEMFTERTGVLALNRSYDLREGIILEGRLQAKGVGFNPHAGFYIEEAKPGAGTAILLQVGHPRWRTSRIGKINLADGFDFRELDRTGPGCATVSGLDDGKAHTFRLWICNGLFELYVDDFLMQTFFYETPTGRIGFLTQGVELKVSDVHAYTMRHRLPQD